MRWMRGLPLLVLLVRLAPAQTQQDVAEISKRVAQSYQAASEYEFVMDVTGADNGQKFQVHALFAFKAPNKYRMEGDFAGLGIGLGESVGVGVDDGVNLWLYRQKENQYNSIPVDKLTPDAPGDLGDARPEFLDNAFRMGFSAMADQFKNGKLLREDSLALSGVSTPCFVIEADSDGQQQRLWVDKSRYVILQLEASDAKMVFTTVKINEALPDDLFKFEPPPGAKKTETPR